MAKGKGKMKQFQPKAKGNWQGQQSKPSGQQPKKKGNCFYCDKPGHYAHECRKKKADEQRNRKKGKQCANIADKFESDLKLFCSILTTGISSPIPWYVDSGASMHMTAHKHWFSKLDTNSHLCSHSISTADASRKESSISGDHFGPKHEGGI